MVYRSNVESRKNVVNHVDLVIEAQRNAPFVECLFRQIQILPSWHQPSNTVVDRGN